ncbi:MAG TPA: transcriptional repressor [Burkholderiaceae bacterium]|nr:transcriptional repressor [Burkholderiaceae bacterium]
MQQALIGMDRVTLYRALDCLVGAGLAHKIAGDDRVFRYSAGTEHANCKDSMHAMQQHGHFKCTSCAKVFCLDGTVPTLPIGAAHQTYSALHEELQNVLQKTLGNGFQSHNIELTIKGWCADCAH